VVAALVVAGIAAALALGGRSSDEAEADEPRFVRPGAPSEEAQELPEEDVPGPPGYTPADAEFMLGMIHHRHWR
jgi:hypothetical protein